MVLSSGSANSHANSDKTKMKHTYLFDFMNITNITHAFYGKDELGYIAHMGD